MPESLLQSLFVQVQSWSEWVGMVTKALDTIDRGMERLHEEDRKQWDEYDEVRKRVAACRDRCEGLACTKAPLSALNELKAEFVEVRKDVGSLKTKKLVDQAKWGVYAFFGGSTAAVILFIAKTLWSWWVTTNLGGN